MKWIFVFIFAAILGVSARADDQREEVISYLQRTFTGPALSYVRRSSTPQLIDDVPALQHYLPQTSFYRVTLQTNQLEYPQLETLVAVTKTPQKTSFVHCFSPLWAAPPASFLAIFQGIRVKHPGLRTMLMRDIADLFAKIIFKGRSGTIFIDSYSTVPLFWDKVHYRDIILMFDASGTLQRVEIRKPEKVQKGI